MFPIFQIGSLSIQVSGLFYLLGLWLGLSIAEKYSYKRGVPSNIIYNLVFITLISGIIFARLIYIINFPSAFRDDPLSVISPNPNMLDLAGGLAGGFLAALIYIIRKKLDVNLIADTFVPVFNILIISTALSDFATGSNFGLPSSLPWAIELWGANRHPIQIYELFAACATLFILWPSRKWIYNLRPGGIFWVFLAFSSFGKLVLEIFRADSAIFIGQYRGMQILALLLLLLSQWKLRGKFPKIEKPKELNSELLPN